MQIQPNIPERMKYTHLFFDLDHTLWDFESNSRHTLQELHSCFNLRDRGISDFDSFLKNYLAHNEILWEKYRNGFIKVDELRWKRMWHTLIDFKIGDEQLARTMGNRFLELLPTRTILFPDTMDVLTYLTDKGYQLHLITNGFEETQHCKLRNSGIDKYFTHVITSECSNSLKPKKEIFEFAFRRTKASPPSSIMIGDSIEVDIQGAINAGIDQVFVNHLHLQPSIRPTYTVHSLQELKTIF
jgi:putative hydrolase of the HAD superfamily